MGIGECGLFDCQRFLVCVIFVCVCLCGVYDFGLTDAHGHRHKLVVHTDKEEQKVVLKTRT